MNAQLPLRQAAQRLLNAWDNRSSTAEASSAMEQLRQALNAEPEPRPADSSTEQRLRNIEAAQKRASAALLCG